MHRSRFALAVVAAITVTVFGVPSRASESSTSAAKTTSTSSDAMSGARFRTGAFALGHARRPAGDTDPTSFAFAPGLTLGVGWRVGSWDIIGQARAAYFQNPSSIDRQTFFGSLGARGRWFVSPSELTPFLDVGVDFSVLAIDMGGGLGPSAHLGGGLEMWHGHAHRRLSLAVGLDVPTFRVDGGNSSASSWFSSPTALYVVPATVSADFTF